MLVDDRNEWTLKGAAFGVQSVQMQYDREGKGASRKKANVPHLIEVNGTPGEKKKR